MTRILKCPIATTLEKIGKKWSMTIIRDIIFGKHHFSDYLKTNPGLTSKVLSDRLKELEAEGFINRIEIETVEGKNQIEYRLTTRGTKLKRVLYALSMFGAEEFPEEVFGSEEGLPYQQMVNIFGNGFKLDPTEVELHQSPQVEELFVNGK